MQLRRALWLQHRFAPTTTHKQTTSGISCGPPLHTHTTSTRDLARNITNAPVQGGPIQFQPAQHSDIGSANKHCNIPHLEAMSPKHAQATCILCMNKTQVEIQHSCSKCRASWYRAFHLKTLRIETSTHLGNIFNSLTCSFCFSAGIFLNRTVRLKTAPVQSACNKKMHPIHKHECLTCPNIHRQTHIHSNC